MDGGRDEKEGLRGSIGCLSRSASKLHNARVEIPAGACAGVRIHRTRCVHGWRAVQYRRGDRYRPWQSSSSPHRGLRFAAKFPKEGAEISWVLVIFALTWG